MSRLHRRLWKVCRDTDQYWATRDGVIPQCDTCEWLLGLEAIGDWGVCSQPLSPRGGLLTFEHMACDYWKHDRREVVAQMMDNIIPGNILREE